MNRLLTVAAFSGFVITHFAFAMDQTQPVGTPSLDSQAENVSTGLPGLPPSPQGKATVIGGQIEKVDPVRDQFTLSVPGGRPIKVLFDARTQLYRDGVKIAPSDLRSGDRAAVETVLDGTNVFALSIHMLSHPPEGECRGQVVSYDSGSHELTVKTELSQQPIRLLVSAETQLSQEGQTTSPSAPATEANLLPGTLISARFTSGNQGQGIASQIAILATPGASYVFSGNIATLDLHAGLIVLADPADDKSYQLTFDPAQLPLSHNLHPGDRVRVTANFNSSRYVVNAIALE